MRIPKEVAQSSAEVVARIANEQLKIRLEKAEEKLRQFGIEWEEGNGYTFTGR